ncbi:hypothetical protein [Bifidobacterium callimiconis]|uniref:hypothetical protein n=1 Tax=Bifidobacterium callimiconis TaxID=2306973 RepID=UPI0013DFB383|nr:hypothetical protein [Bifidobacterium callimiconis]
MFSGIALSQISFVEMSVRNAVDHALREWAEQHGYEDWLGYCPSRQWFDGDEDASITGVPDLVRRLIGVHKIREAWRNCRSTYRKWSADSSHPRHGQYPTRDDIFAQLTFGTWIRLFGPTLAQTNRQNEPFARELWKQALYRAFPSLTKLRVNDRHRMKIMMEINRIKTLRNRVSHGENVLSVKTDSYLDKMLAILAYIDPELSRWVMSQTGKSYRTVAKLKYWPRELTAYQNYDPMPLEKEIVCYKLTHSGEYSGAEVIDCHLRNSEANGGKTLITFGKTPRHEYEGTIQSILLVDATGTKAAIGQIHKYGRDDIEQLDGYRIPDYQKSYEKRKGWFAIDDLHEVDCQGGRVIGYTVNGKFLPEAFGSGQFTMMYVDHQ